MLYQADFSAPDVGPGPSKDGVSARESRVAKPPEKAPEGGRLGNIGKTVGDFRQSARARRFSHQRKAVQLLGKSCPNKSFPGCRWNVLSKATGVDVILSKYATGKKSASFRGLQSCGSVWLCPCCSARVSERRRGEMNQLLIWARENGYSVRMLTLTTRHGKADALSDLLDALKTAKKAFHQHNAYKKIKAGIVGHVTATEVTGGGAHGWHPHLHIILVIEGQLSTKQDDRLRRAWLASLEGAGLSGGGAAFQMQDASQAGEYIAKWGAAEEMTKTGAKQGKRSGRTPWQLLASYADEGDKQAGVLWREYASAFHGVRQLVWQRGLKALAGIDEITDEQAARDEDQGQETRETLNIEHRDWKGSGRRKGARHRRGRILAAMEEGGSDAAAAVVADGGDETAADVVEVELIEPGELVKLVKPVELVKDIAEYRPKPGGRAARMLAALWPAPPCDPDSRIVKDTQKKEGAVGERPEGARSPCQGDSPSMDEGQGPKVRAASRAREAKKPPARPPAGE